MVPADSHKISHVPRYSGYYSSLYSLTFTGLSPSMVILSSIFYFSVHENVVLQPQFCRNKIGLGYSHFARRYYGNHYCFLFLRVLRCFSSPGSPPKKDNKSSTCWVAPFGNFRIRRLFAPTRNLSQLITSFIASVSLGIRHTLLSNFFQLVKN